MYRFLSAITLVLFFSVASLATTVERLTLDDMVKKAHIIVQARVRSAKTHWSADGKLILTTYTLEVHETLKGEAIRSVELTTIGGKIGTLTLYVSGMPSFDAGEDAVVFVEKSGRFSTVVGLNQGKFAVRNGEVSNSLSDLAFPDGREGGPPLRMRLQEFKRQIKNRLN